MPFFLRPGAVTSPRVLQDILRDVHEERRRLIDEEIAERKASGAPLGDGPGGAPEAFEPLAPYEPQPHLEGIMVRLRVVDAALLDEVIEEIEAAHDAPPAEGDRRARRRQDRERLRALAASMRRLVRAAVVEVTGLEDDDGPWGACELAEDDVLALERQGLLEVLFVAARHFQRLDPLGKERCGRRAPRTTSASSSAGDAPSPSAPSEAATAELFALDGRGPSTRTTPVLAGTSSAIRGSNGCGGSTATARADSAASSAGGASSS